jgi:hypothetical protein
MSVTETDRQRRLRCIGMTEEDAQAFEHLWGTRTFVLTADVRTGSLWGHGYTAMDSLDAIWHELDDPEAHMYMQHGFTPHQAFLLDGDRQVRDNLWGPDMDQERVEELLGAKMSRTLLIKTLMVAKSPEEAENLVGALTVDPYHPELFHPELATARVEASARCLPHSFDTCDCPASVLITPEEFEAQKSRRD